MNNEPQCVRIRLLLDENDNLRWSLHGPNHGELPACPQPPWREVFAVDIDPKRLQGSCWEDYIADKLHAAFRAGEVA